MDPVDHLFQSGSIFLSVQSASAYFLHSIPIAISKVQTFSPVLHSSRWVFSVPCSLFNVSGFCPKAFPRPIPISRLFIQPATPEVWLATPMAW
jgi:hypothetical protein